jgi:Holliday junction resolvase RusA-like endonuclease
VIDIALRCVPPSITAQQKRVHVVAGRPVFFHGAKMREAAATWASLLSPHQPIAPMDGPLALSLRFVYPHLKATKKADAHRLLPKVTKPDAGNVAKHLEDQLVRLRFIADDARIAKLTVEKFHGPEAEVGIRIQIAHFQF